MGLVTGWWKVLGWVLGLSVPPYAAGVCDGHMQVPTSAASSSHTHPRAEGEPAEPRSFTGEVSLGREIVPKTQSVLAWELLKRSLDVSVSPVEETLDSALSAVQAGSTREGGTLLGSSSLVSAGRKTPGP